jgi:hypothetical protein
VALEQFALKYGQFGGAAHSPLGLALLAYQKWLDDHGQPHTPARFRTWAHEAHHGDAQALTRSSPGAPAIAR